MAVSLLFAALEDKDVKGMVREICRQIHFDSVVTVTVDTPRAVPARELAELFSKEGEERVYCRESAADGLRLALSLRPEGGLLFCAGSLYLAGELQAEFERRKAAEDRFGGKDDQL
jgi:dihydrofolate synthase/folylpolyglutamate synthase